MTVLPVISHEQRQLLSHTLGACSRYAKRDWGFRNYFTTEEGCKDVKQLRELVSLGLMVERERFGDLVFSATKQGAMVVGFKRYQLAGKSFPT